MWDLVIVDRETYSVTYNGAIVATFNTSSAALQYIQDRRNGAPTDA